MTLCLHPLLQGKRYGARIHGGLLQDNWWEVIEEVYRRPGRRGRSLALLVLVLLEPADGTLLVP